MDHNLRRQRNGMYMRDRATGSSNYEEECFTSRDERDARWEELMLVKPHVMKDSTSEHGATIYRVRYPRLVLVN